MRPMFLEAPTHSGLDCCRIRRLFASVFMLPGGVISMTLILSMPKP